MSIQNLLKICPRFNCDLCDYNTCKKSSYDGHLLSAKHKKSIIVNNNQSNSAEILPTPFTCQKCNKTYKDNSGLWRHKQKCKIDEKLFINDKDQLIIMLIKQNSELLKEQSSIKQMIVEQQNIVLEIAKNGTHNTTNTNSHNKAFNLNFFLNETCKDAMNITEFVNSIQLQLSDLERMGEVGYVEGLTSIISRNLKALDVNMRPVHCTDKKREIMYIKDETKWEKDEENIKMHKMIKNVAFENQRQILKYKEIHPDCGKSSSKYSDPYNKILVECMGGAGDNDFEKEERIISKISKCVLVDKDTSI
jgi:hypothetical protein